MADHPIASRQLAASCLAQPRFAIDDVERHLGVREETELLANLLGDRDLTLGRNAHDESITTSGNTCLVDQSSPRYDAGRVLKRARRTVLADGREPDDGVGSLLHAAATAPPVATTRLHVL